MRVWHRLVVMAAVSAWAIGPAPAAATESLKACFVAWAPYTVMAGDKADGVSVEILETAARRAGFLPAFAEMPHARCKRSVLKGGFDVLMDSVHGKPGFVHGEIYFSLWALAWYVRDDHPLKTYSGLKDLDGGTVALVRDYGFPEAVMTYSGYSVIYGSNEQSQVNMLEAKRVEAALGDVMNFRHLAQAGNLAIRHLNPPVAIERLYPLFEAGREARMRRIDDALAGMIEDGSIDAIYQRRMGLTYSGLTKAYGIAAPTRGRVSN